MQQTINPELRWRQWRQWRASIAFSRHFNWIWTFISRLSQTVNANWEMKTVSLFVWGSCFKTWIIHNHLGNLRWNVPPLYDQVSKVSRSRSRKGHRSHKLCCQPPPDSGVSDAGPSLWAALSRCIPHKIIVCLSSVVTLTPGIEANTGRATRGQVPTTESPRDERRQQNLWGTGPDLTNQRPEVRPGDQWEAVTRPVRARCASGQESPPETETSPAPAPAQSALVLRDKRTQTGIPWAQDTWHGTQTLTG